jgi:nucleotide-binding universal stress UspA family protein
MFITFLIMLSIELSLLWDKPEARLFAGAVLLTGIILRELARENSRAKKTAAAAAAAAAHIQSAESAPATLAAVATLPIQLHEASGPPMMCAVRGLGKTLDFAIEEARQCDRPLYLLFIRTVPVLTEEDYKRKWQDDPEAREVFLEARKKSGAHPVFPCYAVSDSVAHTIVDITATMGASYLVLGAPERRGLSLLLRGNIIREISDNLPDDIHLLVYA